MKEKSVTYIHRDRSIGSSFSPMDAILGSKAYVTETRDLKETLQGSVGSFGLRVEIRCSLWAANKLLEMDPLLWRTRFLSSGAILAFRTSEMVRYKVILLDSYDWLCQQLQHLPKAEREDENVCLLAAALTYLMHGIVSRPDDMSASREMVFLLRILERCRRYGIPSIPPEYLSDDLTRIMGDVTIERFSILKYMRRKCPAGARVKGSRVPKKAAAENEEGNRLDQSDDISGLEGWSSEDDAWAKEMINKVLANWLWARLPVQDKRQDAPSSRFRGPFMLHRWSQCVDTGVRKHEGSLSSGFDKVVGMLLPRNWVLTQSAPCWSTYDGVFLERIRDRIEEAPANQMLAYSTQVREALTRVIKTWQYLPYVQANKFWVYDGAGKTRAYKLHRNPNVIAP
ncbi:hypothetical protein FRC11_011596 [Ceratobasidium sp. 423]|nr:hypothetical protein FRC11_011596 [Ceratobasidium sp. 423]